jgi:uncharacterized protein (TIGR03083 family)
MTSVATRLDPSTYLDHIASESGRFRGALSGCDPAARVPACPDWDAADLLWHLTEVQWFWSAIVTGRPDGPERLVHPERPPSYDGLLEAFDTASAGLVAALGTARPDEQAWTWAPEQSVGFTYRRQAHEALVHRLDAEQTAGAVTAVDPLLAADGVHECLAVMYGGCPPWGRFTPGPARVRVDLTDVEVSLSVSLGRFTGTDPESGTSYDEDGLEVVDDPGTVPDEPDAVVSGTAADIDAWLWRRAPHEAVTQHGDPAALAHLARVLEQPLD